jgi:hypothetical protein
MPVTPFPDPRRLRRLASALMSQKGGELTFPGLLTELTLTAMGRLPKVLLTIKSARGGLSR